MPVAAEAVFTALGDPTRRRLIERLASLGRASATSLSAELPISRQAVAKHLALLREARLVSSSRAGRETLYRLDPAPLQDAAQWLVRVGAEWDGRLAELDRLFGSRSRQG